MAEDENRPVIPLYDLAREIAGEWTDDPPETIRGVKIHSDNCSSGDLFVGLPGDNTHGQRFVDDAFDRGAVAVVVESAQPAAGPQLVVDDSTRALQNLAKSYRDLYMVAEVVGITGSSGKTTTREMIADVFRSSGLEPGVTRTNQNNHIGLPLTILNEGHRAPLVAEVGISEPGEMERHRQLLKPTVGVLTTIGPAHTKGLGSQDRIAEEKSALFEAPRTEPVVVPATIPRRGILEERIPNLVTLSFTHGEDDQLTVELMDTDGFENWIELPDPGLEEPFLTDAVLAVAVGDWFGVDAEKSMNRLADFKALPGRGEECTVDGMTVLDGSYNANPQSMAKALQRLSNRSGRRGAILGTMKELGEQAARRHEELGRRLDDLDLDRVWFVGQYGDRVAAGTSGTSLERLSSPDELPSLQDLPQDVILVKASNSVGLGEWLDEEVEAR